MPRLDLVEPRGEFLGATGHRAIRLLALWHAVLFLGGLASRPLTPLLPLLRNLTLEVGQGSWEGHRLYFDPALVIVAKPLHPVRVWLLCRHLGALIGFLVADDAFVSRAPPDLYAMRGRDRRSAAMCFRARMASCCPGPGSSDAIRLMAACAPEKIVTRSGVVLLYEADSRARVRVVHSAS